jgi:hypothetical protein
MNRKRSPRCLSCTTKPARPRDHFCSYRCGWIHAEGHLSAGEGVSYCDHCGHPYREQTPENPCEACGFTWDEDETED